MELTQWIRKMTSQLKQYKYGLLIVLIGIVFMLLPNANNEPEQVISQNVENIMTVEQQLGSILSHVYGAGEVRVFLTQASGEEILYQSNSESRTSADGSSLQLDTVTVTDQNRNEDGLIRQINPPKYLGAILVCKGADNPAVRLALVEAVSRVTGLGADKISVLKMG